MRRAVRTVKGHCPILLFISLSAEKNGGLIPFGVSDGFVVAVHLKRWFSVYNDSSIGIARVRFREGSISHFVAGYAFRFGIVFCFRDPLNVTLVLVQFDLLFANVAFSPSTRVLRSTMITVATYVFVKFIDVTAVWALFVRVADGFDLQASSLQVIIVTSVSKEFSMTEGAEFVGVGKLSTSFDFQEIGAVLSFTGGTPFTVTGMILVIVVVESSVTLVAEVGSI